MWALDGLAWVFDWAAGRFWDLASALRGFWIWDWQPLAWAGDIAEGLAIFCWTARDRIRDFAAWIDGQLAILRQDLYYLKEGIRLEIEYRVRQLIDGLLGGVEWIRQRVEDAWNKATELWGIVWTTIKPTVDWLNSQFGTFKVWVENTAIPGLQTLVTNLGTRLDQLRGEASTWWTNLQSQVADINTYRDTWNLIRNSYERVRFTFTDGWDKLGAFLVDPPGTIWAWLEPILLDRVEQFLNEKWDTRR